VNGGSVRSGGIAGPDYGARLDRAQAGLVAMGHAALLLGLGADLRYLTGYAAHALERLTMLVLTHAGPPALVAPRLEAMAAAACPAAASGRVDVLAWDETDDPHALVAGRVGGLGGRSSLFVDAGLPARHLLALQRALPGCEFRLAAEVLRPLRAVKDAWEIGRLRAAAHAADRVVAQIAAGRLVGRAEAEVSREVRDRLVAEGHDVAAFAIVASGPNGASPHHEPSDRRIQAGEPIVLDIGGTFDGYGSDITRMLWVTGDSAANAPTEAFMTAFELVRQAHRAATATVRPGASCGDLDAVARGVIRDGGLGDAFIHRLGHGIGLEGHEEPYLVAGSAERIAPGNAFSIEPGVYLPGRFGVRIEDIVVCTADGADVLNEASRDLLVVAG
jgi:Xaa-Pro aminopeptidase